LRLRPLSLAQRFLAANLAILVVAGLVVGIWVGNQLEQSIIDRTASVTALYVESIIEPSVASMADGGQLTPDEVSTLDAYLTSSAMAERVRSMRIWSADGQVVYSPDAELIGQRFPVEGNLAEAWKGKVTMTMDDLSGAENTWERARWARLLEMYVPVRQRGTDRIIAVAEFYLPPGDFEQQVSSARLTTWLLVSLAIAVAAVLLWRVVKRGSDTIERQEATLSAQVVELTDLLEQNAQLSERVHQAAARSTTLNERTMRRVSSDLHDGPGQMLSLALLRLDGLEKRAARGEAVTADEFREVEAVLEEAMSDMRTVAAGLRLPELAPMSVEAVVSRAVQDHQRRSGTPVHMTVAGAPAQAPLPVKIALFRALQEGMSNATRHGACSNIEVTVSAEAAPGRPDGAGLHLVVRDDGSGFDPVTVAHADGLGLAGIREQAEVLGGRFWVDSRPGAGAELDVWWPLRDGRPEP
jgi:signal transduction histidine kinase